MTGALPRLEGVTAVNYSQIKITVITDIIPVEEKEVRELAERLLAFGIRVTDVKKTEVGFRLYVDEVSHVDVLRDRLNFYIMRRIPCELVDSVVQFLKKAKEVEEVLLSHLNPMFGLYFAGDRCYVILAASLKFSGIPNNLANRLSSTYFDLLRSISLYLRE